MSSPRCSRLRSLAVVALLPFVPVHSRFALNLCDKRAVSYTHLDVYKRQAVGVLVLTGVAVGVLVLTGVAVGVLVLTGVAVGVLVLTGVAVGVLLSLIHI